jgi:hypothetical protein
MVSVPVRAPVAMGANVTVITHVDAPAITLVQPELVWEKSPLMVIPEMVSVALPLLVTVTNWPELVVPVAWLEKVRVLAERVTAGLVVVVVVLLEPPPQPIRTINPIMTAAKQLRVATERVLWLIAPPPP